ncbi:MAG: hypothetical protein M1825_000110 [Sarcosagium campestre]|nr:MAG: hypothetical protein M1825_000110 [Sarcosagium campestre]
MEAMPTRRKDIKGSPRPPEFLSADTSASFLPFYFVGSTAALDSVPPVASHRSLPNQRKTKNSRDETLFLRDGLARPDIGYGNKPGARTETQHLVLSHESAAACKVGPLPKENGLLDCGTEGPREPRADLSIPRPATQGAHFHLCQEFVAQGEDGPQPQTLNYDLAVACLTPDAQFVTSGPLVAGYLRFRDTDELWDWLGSVPTRDLLRSFLRRRETNFGEREESGVVAADEPRSRDRVAAAAVSRATVFGLLRNKQLRMTALRGELPTRLVRQNPGRFGDSAGHDIPVTEDLNRAPGRQAAKRTRHHAAGDLPSRRSSRRDTPQRPGPQPRETWDVCNSIGVDHAAPQVPGIESLPPLKPCRWLWSHGCGLGKTIQTLAHILIASRRQVAADQRPFRPTLVLAPSHVLNQWIREISGFFRGHLTLWIWHGHKSGCGEDDARPHTHSLVGEEAEYTQAQTVRMYNLATTFDIQEALSTSSRKRTVSQRDNTGSSVIAGRGRVQPRTGCRCVGVSRAVSKQGRWKEDPSNDASRFAELLDI